MHSMDRYHRATLLNAARYHSHSTVFSTCKTRCISTIIPSGSTLFFMARSGPDTRQSLQEFMKANAKVTHVTICWVLYSAICVPPCENGVCDKPGTCICEPGWTASRCRIGKQQHNHDVSTHE